MSWRIKYCVPVILALALVPAQRARSLEISSATLSDIHQLAGPAVSSASVRIRLSAFPEKLVFDLSWGVIAVGQATMEAEDLARFDGRPAFHIVSRATSNSFCDAFYKVRDLNESWIDAEKLGSLGYAKRLREGRFFRDEWVVYDQPNRRFLAKTINKDGGFHYSSGTIPAQVQDILSSLYYVRSQPLSPGRDITVDVNTKQNWPLVMRVIRKERIRVPAGQFDTIVVEPAIRKDGIFIQKGRKLRVWLTDDSRRMPVHMEVEIFFGHVSASLAKML